MLRAGTQSAWEATYPERVWCALCGFIYPEDWFWTAVSHLHNVHGGWQAVKDRRN